MMTIARQSFHCSIRVILLAWLVGCSAVAALGQPSNVTVVSSVGNTLPVAPESIAVAYGTGLATKPGFAMTLPLPTTLAGTSLTLKDSVGTERLALLLFV